MTILYYNLLFQFVILVNDKYVMTTSYQPHSLTMESSVINIHIPDIDICHEINTDDCKILIYQMQKCQQIIFNDPGFSYQQYKENIDVHKQILFKYQLFCEGTPNDSIVNDSLEIICD